VASSAVAAEDRVLGVDAVVRVADDAAGPVAAPGAAVVGAAAVLQQVATEGACVSDLRRCHARGGQRQGGVALAYHRVALKLGQRRQRAKAQATVHRLLTA
jgi:hypothetical protein